MPILHNNAGKFPWPANSEELRWMLGLPARLGDQFDGKTFSLQGYTIKILSVAEARRLSPTRARKPHRIVAECKSCGRWIPVGRLRQHEPACERAAK